MLFAALQIPCMLELNRLDGLCIMISFKQRNLNRLILFISALLFWMLYSVIHEMGHILALKAFGAWGQDGALLIPLPGQIPHVSGDPTAHLEHWQIAIAAIAGGLLPTLVGYLSFILWISPYGSRCREQSLRIEMIWLMFTIMMLFPQAIPAPMLFPNAIHDRDYTMFIQNVPISPWLANTAIALIALVNLILVVWVIKSLFMRIRAVKKSILIEPHTMRG